MKFIPTRRTMLYTPPVAAAGAWTPASLGANLLGWWKADAGVTPGTNGSATTQWDDQSGNANHLTPATTGPTYTTGVLNSLPGLVWVTPFSMSMTKSSFPLGTGAAASMFCVMKLNAATSNPRTAAYVVTGSDTSATAGIFIFHTSGTNASAFKNGGTKSTGTIPNSTFMQLGSIFDGANSTVYINGTGQTPVAETNTFAATGVFGINPGFATYDATVCEMFVTNSALSGTDRTNTAAYFLAKWGV
jgi:hypothetical protein